MNIKDELYKPIKAECRLSDDGTLWIITNTIEEIRRVIIEDNSIWCKTFYQDGGD